MAGHDCLSVSGGSGERGCVIVGAERRWESQRIESGLEDGDMGRGARPQRQEEGPSSIHLSWTQICGKCRSHIAENAPLTG